MNLLTLVFFLVPVLTFSQAADFPRDENGKMSFTEVVNVDRSSSQILYSKAKLFLAKKYPSLKEVMYDDEPHTIMVNPISETPLSLFKALNGKGSIKFKIIVEAKDNRYKYTLSDFTYEEIFPDNKSLVIPMERSYADQDKKMQTNWVGIIVSFLTKSKIGIIKI